MIKFGKGLLASLFCAAMLCFSVLPCFAAELYTNADLQTVMQEILSWKKRNVGSEENLLTPEFVSGAGSAAADWYAMTLGRVGEQDDYAVYLALLQANVEARYQTPGKLDAQKATEWHRIALTVLALGGDPTAFGTDGNGAAINLIADGTYDRSKTAPLGAQGLNAYIWALITLDSKGYPVPDGAADTRETMLDAIVAGQLNDGGFSLDGETSDVDITAMALQALSSYTEDDTISESVEKGLVFLSEQQGLDGDFISWGEANPESTAQVLVALCTLGIDPENDSRFIKNGNHVLDGLMKYRTEQGGFAHSVTGDLAGVPNSLTSEQVLYALCALYRYRTGLRSLYDMRPETSQQPAGTIYSIFEGGNVSSGLLFSENDLQVYRALPQPLTGEQYTRVLYLYTKLTMAENSGEYAQLLPDLTEKKEAVENIYREVENINAEIAAYLYPFTNITRNDKEQVLALTARVDKLSDYDKQQILGLEDLYRAKVKLTSDWRAVWIWVIAAILVTILVAVLIWRVQKKKRLQGKNNEFLENEDW